MLAEGDSCISFIAKVTSLNCAWFLTLSFSHPQLSSFLISIVFCSFPAGENTRKHHKGKTISQRTGRYLWVISLSVFFFFFLLGGLREDFPVTRLGLFPGKCHSTDCYPTWRSILHCCSKFPLALVIVLPFDVSSGSPWVRTKIFVLEGQTLINVTLFLLHDLLVLTLITYSCCNKKWIDGL